MRYSPTVTIFNRRNALVGYVVMEALHRRRWQRRRHALKIAAFVALGIVSAGILAALLAVALRRNGNPETEDVELDMTELEAELDAGIPDSAMPEPGFAE